MRIWFGVVPVFGRMDKRKNLRGTFLVLFIITFIVIFIFLTNVRTPRIFNLIPQPHGPVKPDLPEVSDQTITPLVNTKHLLVSAFMDQRVTGFDIRIIGIFRRDSIQSLYCIFLCLSSTLSSTTPTNILQHADNFGFSFTATDVMCQIPQSCDATHVTLLTQPDYVKDLKQKWLPIRNKVALKKEDEFEFDFTVCVSTLFGGYNNVLQFAQTLEMYRLLGVDRVVIYNTSCGPELNRLLHQGW
ncbi:uncharacterized protein LOC121201963 isoform X2 [Betta splendens]|uniref:Glycosyltransferase family 92 protein n=1 Tax=Betta splendens TaxID=158456 RepID=A0A9W2XJL8_BETSP|nr:uncharacterized protein LOC121201963 isoform X2 [Betta splendens]